MTRQISFLDDPPPLPHNLTARERERVGLARNTDPESSHEAAAQMVASRTLKRHEEMILDLVYMMPGSTVHELAERSAAIHQADALDHVQIGKRVKAMDGLKVGEIRKCRVCGRRMQTWEPK